MVDSNQIKDTIKALQEKADLIDIMEALCSAESFLDNKILKKCGSSSELSTKIHNLIKESLSKHIEFIKNNVDYSSVLSISPDELIALKALADKVIGGVKNTKSLTNKKATDIGSINENTSQAVFAVDPNYKPNNSNASNNEQTPLNKKNTAYILDPTSCMNIVGSSYNSTPASQRILMGAKIQILKDEGETFRARLVGDNIEFSIYKDLVEFK